MSAVEPAVWSKHLPHGTVLLKVEDRVYHLIVDCPGQHFGNVVSPDCLSASVSVFLDTEISGMDYETRGEVYLAANAAIEEDLRRTTH